ncbi:hypothetical protein FHS57_003938 [Runella defluvii]|uniref:Uncharacterized protein n=1 Tax=Runella defluvii TaxID=370973 RepID=A0A7W6ERX4_9BACT|nr:hypothetical protein [Runella defluvii]MBB3839927.1 hypothetical protein [Runella defluvii]
MIKNGLLWVVFVLMTASSLAQKPAIERPDPRKTTKVKDTTRVSLPIDSLFKAKLDAPTAKDTAFGKTAKKVIPKTFYNVLFRDIDRHIDSGQVAQMEQNPHLPFAGRWIREIHIHSLDVFGYSVHDTLQVPGNWTERTGNKLHRSTRERTILRNYLFFEEGDVIDPEKMRDNERYLRQQGIFHDARIVIVPFRNAKDAVDVHVYTQDLWSLLPDGSASNFDNFTIGIEQRNFRGLGQSFKNTVSYNGRDERQRLEYAGRYFIPSFGKTFVAGEGILNVQRDQKQLSFKAYRPFLTPQMKYAGAIELGYYNRRLFEFTLDSLTGRSVRNYFWSQYVLFDAWMGRSFRIFFGDDKLRERARFVVALRHTRQSFYNRDRSVTDSTNQLFQNTRPTLLSIGYSNRRYQRDLLIYGFGRTEDVPVGDLVSFVYGSDPAELGDRKYIGLKYSRARYIKIGYLYNLTNIGTYIKDGATEQGVFSTENNYFTPLHRFGGEWYARHFINLKFAWGFNRFANEYFNISGNEGIRGISSDELRGTRKLVIGAETVFFSPLNFLGFRVAPFTFADLGWTAFSGQYLFRNKPFAGYGLGFRFRNENLTFTTFQVRLSIYSGIPDIGQPFRANFDGVPPLRFRDFDISAPEIVQFK